MLYFVERDRKVGDSETDAIVKMSVRGGTQTVLYEESTLCLDALTMNYPILSIYWNLGCRKSIDVIKMDGTGYRNIYDGNNMIVANAVSEGIAHFKDALYWTDTERVFKLNTTTNNVEKILENRMPSGIRIFHSSLQPSGLLIAQDSKY